MQRGDACGASLWDSTFFTGWIEPECSTFYRMLLKQWLTLDDERDVGAEACTTGLPHMGFIRRVEHMHFSNRKRKNNRAFSLVELVIVIVIIGVIAAVAIPRVSRASRGAGDSALSSNLAVLRNAIELYASEHNGSYPGSTADGTGNAGGTPEAFVSQMTMYSNAAGACVDTKDDDHPYGPYLRKGIPVLPVGANKGSSDVHVDVTASPPPATPGNGKGWVVNTDTGDIIANSTDDNETKSTTYDKY
ncbi:MAG: hypothetical protein AMXMBFR13_12710 [Phycisphaerae bacterium]